MRKIKMCISVVLLFLLSFGNTFAILGANNLEGERSIVLKDVVNSRGLLEDISLGEQYSKSIDEIVEKISTNESKLRKLDGKLALAEKKLRKVWTQKAKNLLKVVSYARNKIKLELLNIEIELQKKQDEEAEMIQNELENPSLTDKELKLVDEKIVELQLNLFSITSNQVNKWVDDYNELLNYEEKGDLSFSLNYKDKSNNSISNTLDLNNYHSTVSGFDSRFKSDLSYLMKGVNNNDNVNLELDTFVDYITKDGALYIFLKDLEIVNEEGLQELEEYLDIIKNIGEQNKFVKYYDENSVKAFELLNSISPKNIISEGEGLLSQPLFKAYRKDGDKYYIIPTKYACDELKVLLNMFDPFNPETCSDGQYEDMVSSFAKPGHEIYIKVGSSESSLNIEVDNQFESFNADIVYTKDNIKELNLDLRNKKNKNFLSLKSKLDNNNSFNYIDFDSNINENGMNLSSQYNLANRIISGFLEMETGRYDYVTKKGTPLKKYTFNISGKTKMDNSLDSLNIITEGKDLVKNIKVFDGAYTYDNGENTLVINAESEGMKTDIDISINWNKTEKMIDDFDSKIYTYQKEVFYDTINKQIAYTGAFEPVLISEINLLNGNINGETKLISKDIEYLTISNQGTYEKKYLDLKNSFMFDISTGFSNIKYSGDFDMMIDQRLNKNNIEVVLDIFEAEGEKMLDAKLSNVGTFEYKEVEVETPSDYIDYEDIID